MEEMAGSMTSLMQISVIIALMFFALWKRGWLRAILSLSLITWGAFMTPYDMKIAAPLIGVGTLLFFTSIFNLLGKGVRDNG